MDRVSLRAAIGEALEPLEFVRAAWEGGSTGFGTEDEWSDLDLLVLADPAHKEDVFDAVYSVLEELGGIDDLWRLPEPTWHGHSQAFIRPKGAPEHLLVDLVVQDVDTGDPGLEPQLHGTALVVFDKDDVVHPWPWDAGANRVKMLDRLDENDIQVRMFGHFADKAAARSNQTGAIDALRSTILRPLHEVLRMRYVPERWDYSTRYVRRDLPADVADRLDALWSTTDLADIAAARAAATAWYFETAAEVRSAP